MSSLPLSAPAASATPTDRDQLDQALSILKDKAREWARLPPAAKAALLRECIPKLADASAAWAAEGSKAKRLPPGDAEEWLAGPMITIRIARLLADSLDAIAARGKPPLGRGAHTRPDGRLEIEVFPTSAMDRLLFGGFSGTVLMQEGIDRATAARKQAAFYSQRDPEGGVSLVLGAGNVSSIPPTDALTKMFVEGMTCILKMNPVNEWCGPILERALSPLLGRGYLRIAYGGADVGEALVRHPLVDDVHITGSDRTHDLIVWGPPGPERDRRLAENDPLLDKPISSELGNVSPVAIVPADYTEDQLWFQARNVGAMVANNASFNCNAAKMLITSSGWAQRDRFLELVTKVLGDAPTRLAYYPGAADRYATLTEGRQAATVGSARKDELPWTLIRDVDASRRDEPLFRVEPFCAILSETSLDATDPAGFVDSAARFMNDVLWGTLNACLIVHPRLEADPTFCGTLDRAVVELRYGTVAINHWPAVCYGSGSMPWGGHPSANLRDVQSGLGWVHNTFMLEGIDKSVLRGPLTVKPTPIWFTGVGKAARTARKLIRLEAEPSWLKLPGIIWSAL